MKTLNTRQAADPAASKPEPRVAEASSLFYGLTRLLVGLVLPFIARLRTEGTENIPKSGPVILAMNHIHWLDIPLASFPVSRINHYMAKIELFSTPLFGGYLRIVGAFPVRRGEGDREALHTGERLLAEGEAIVIFPEGHRSGDGTLQKAHPGAGYIAMRTGAPVVAVAISGTQKVFKTFRPIVTIRYSQPFTVSQVGEKRTRDSVAQATDQIMYHIAALLPEGSRGPYADYVAGANATAPTSQK